MIASRRKSASHKCASRSIASRLIAVALVSLAVPAGARAQDDGGKAFAENSMQAYLAMWDRGVSPATVQRFYAPRVTYYGKPMTRAQVLADKQAFVRSWPERHYREVPGSFQGRCNADRSRCEISAVVAWRRVGRGRRISTGRALVRLTFVPVDGGRKIAQESARIL